MLRGRKALAALVGSIGSAAVVGLVAGGCNGSSSPRYFDDLGDVGLAAHSPASVAHSAGQMALHAAMAVMEPGTFPPVDGNRPNVSYSGTATNGGVVVDFGGSNTSGTEISDATLRGELEAVFTRNGNSVIVTITFTTLVATTEYLGTVAVDGTMTYNGTINGNTVTGNVSGSIDTDNSFDFSTFTPSSMSFTFSSAGTNVLTGSGTVASTARGNWGLTYADVTYHVNPFGQRWVDSGSAVVTRNSGSAVSVSLLFTGPNVGTLTISPGGTTRSFDL